MDLPAGIFKRSARGIAQGLKRSVLRSRRTKGTKFQSAISMLNLYINRSHRAGPGAPRSARPAGHHRVELGGAVLPVPDR